MFYATHKYLDKQQYNAMFNRKLPGPIYDQDGNSLGTGEGYKFQINNKIKSNMKVASEDSGAKVFLDLWHNNRDFYNFVTDESRMAAHFVKDKYKFKGYREAKRCWISCKTKTINQRIRTLKPFIACSTM